MVSEFETPYATVNDLARFIHKELERYQRLSPGIATLVSLFRTMYAASMATEEGQAITFELTWADPENPDPAPPGRIVADRWTAIPLASRIPLTTRALVKAAKATDPRTSSFAIFATEEGSLFIWGMVDQGNRIYDFMRFDSDEGQARPGVFQASAVGIGHLVVSAEFNTLAELRIDRPLIGGLHPLGSGPIFEALQPGLEDYVNAVKATVSTEIYEDRDHWGISLESQWLETLARVLLCIRGMGHGGAVLITPDTSGVGLDIKYKLEYSRLPEALRRLGTATILKTHASDLNEESLDADESVVDAGIYLDELVASAEEKEAKSEVDGTLWFIACLSRVDGLVLMGPRLSVQGFGTVITVEEAPDTILAARDDVGDPKRLEPLSYDAFGTRHRSMMRYCNSCPGSVGFVVSQDGDVRVMTKVEDRLVVWDGVQLERVFPRSWLAESDAQ